MILRRICLLSSFGVATTFVLACGTDPESTAGGSGGAAAGSGGAAAGVVNQCGVAAPLPAETGQCKVKLGAAITNFDDYGGTNPSGYTYNLNGAPPAADAVLGALQHVGDGSDTAGGSSVIATEMVTGEGDDGQAIQISNTNAANWGGLLMFYFPYSGAVATCLDARSFSGVEFSVKGSSPSGRFGVNLGMLDTIPTADHGLCDKQGTNDCKDPSVELTLPAQASTWAKVQLPWSAFTPGVAADLSCVPATGQNIVRLVIQPFMNYPPPDYVFAPGAYALAIDNVRFY